MADYSQVSKDVVDGILEIYELPASVEITPQGHGISNSNYKVNLESGETCLLKVSNDKNINQLLDEQKILLALSERDFPYSLTPYLTSNQEPVYQYKNFYGVVYPFVDATVPEISSESLREIGSKLAVLHYLKFDKQEVRASNEVGFDLESIRDYTETPYCPIDFKEAFRSVFDEKEIITYLNIQKPHSLIHGDLFYDNTMFKDDKLIKMIDFEQAGLGDPLLDLGICIGGSCLKSNEVDPDYVEVLLNAYISSRPLSEQDLEYLDLCIHTGLFSIALWRIKRFYEGTLDEKKKNSYQELIKRSLNYRKLKS